MTLILITYSFHHDSSNYLYIYLCHPFPGLYAVCRIYNSLYLSERYTIHCHHCSKKKQSLQNVVSIILFLTFDSIQNSFKPKSRIIILPNLPAEVFFQTYEYLVPPKRMNTNRTQSAGHMLINPLDFETFG